MIWNYGLKKSRKASSLSFGLKRHYKTRRVNGHINIYMYVPARGGKKKYEKKFPDTKWLTNHFMTCHDHIVDQSPVV
jgi:hypothetical protein